VKIYFLPPGFSVPPEPAAGKAAAGNTAAEEAAGKKAVLGRGLIFDMDGTLYSHAEYLASQTELPLRRLARFHGKTYGAMKAEFDAYRAAWEREHRGRPGEEKISMGNAFRAFGIPIEESVRWREELYQPERYLTKDPPLRAALLRLSGNGSPGPSPREAPFLLAVLTNNPVSIARRTLRCLGVEDCFSAVTGLDTCMISKPHPVPFRLAAESLGLPPERCVSIGDRYEIDIALPLEMGMGGILTEGAEDLYTLPDLLLPR
jgi:phosphoglycolate phosphatase/putative hydrolase of the HAD superfamily